MTTSTLSAPTLFTSSDLHFNPALTAAIIRLANDAFLRPNKLDPVKWSATNLRFSALDSYTRMLVDDSVVALIFDDGDYAADEISHQTKLDLNGNKDRTEYTRKLVACAAAVPWTGGWLEDRPQSEEGWEMKAVCVDGDARYARSGLAVQLLAFLEEHLISHIKFQLGGHIDDEGKERVQGSLTLWIQAAECLNGAYWRKRGYHEMRRSTQGEGVWGCQTSFELVVLRNIVHFDITA